MRKPFKIINPSKWYCQKGDDKPKKAEVKPTVSSYNKVNSGSFSTDFGSGFSTLAKDPNNPKQKIFQTSANLSPELAAIGHTAGGMLGNNLDYLQRNPEERVSWLTGGNDPYYNIFSEQAKRATQEAIGRQLVNAQQGGITNSTTFGSALGRIANDDILRKHQILQSALDFNNNNARTDAQLGLGAITGLNSLITPYGSAAAAQLQTAKGSQDRAAEATAAAQNQAEMQYVQAMNQYNAQKQASMGNMLGTGLGILGSIGGNMLLPGFGGMIGSGLGNFLGNGIGGASSLFNGAGAGIGALFNTSGMNGALGGFGSSMPVIA